MTSRRAIKLRSRAVGLDVTDDSIRAIEVAGGVVRTRAEIALPPGAVVSGEVIDAVVVTAALRQLWKDSRLRSRAVVLGAPGDTIVARQADLPDLDDDDLRHALRFEAEGVIPFAISDCVLDYREIERVRPDDGPASARVLVVAARRSALVEWARVLSDARLRLKAVDHWAHALLRASGGASGAEHNELIVDIGSDALAIAIHRGGIVRFARSLPGFSTAASMSFELESELARIEQFRQSAAGGTTQTLMDTLHQRDPIVDAVRSTIEYLEYQPGDVTLESVRITGDLERALPVVAQLSELLSVHVAVVPRPVPPELDGFDPIHPERDLLTVGHAMALTDRTPATMPMALMAPPARSRTSSSSRRIIVIGVSTLVAGGLGALTMQQRSNASQARAERRHVDQLATRAGVRRAASGSNATQLEANRLVAQANIALERDIDWARLLEGVVGATPADYPALSVHGIRTNIDDSDAALGTVTVTANGTALDASAAWLKALGTVAGLANPWPGSPNASTAVAPPAAGGARGSTVTGQRGTLTHDR
jgi:type IV pilus assembly protein PilM